MMDTAKERFNWLDLARGFVIILMLIGHSWGVPPLVVQAIFGFHMPFFFILSGYLYNRDKYNQLGIKKLIKMRWKAYVIPYFVLSFVNLIINIPVEFVDGLRGKELLTSTIHHIFWIFYSWGSAARTPNCTPLWFLPCLFIASIYFYYLLKIKSISLQIVMCVSAIVLDVVLYIFKVPQLPWHIEIALIGAVFMYVGLKMKEFKIMERIEHRIPFIIIGMILGFYCIFTNPRIDINSNTLNNVVLLYAGSVSVTFSILLLCKYYVKRCTFLEWFGRNTILIMGFNCAINMYTKGIWVIILKLGNKVNLTWWMLSIADVICCMIIIWIWGKIRAGGNRMRRSI